jgi:adenine-specific DNA-methyltransferase
MELVPINLIKVEDRVRSSFDGSGHGENKYGETIAFLAESIKSHGLLHPIVLERTTLRLLAGERRLRACKLLGWEAIPVTYLDQLSPTQRLEVELEENLARKNLTWQEQALTTKKLDELKRSLYGSADGSAGGRPTADSPTDRKTTDPASVGWSNYRTADIRGVDVKTVRRDLALANAMTVLPSLAEEKSQSNALRKVDHLIEDIERELTFRKNQQALLSVKSNVLLGDARDLIQSLPVCSVDCIITDPPYGLSLGSSRLVVRDGVDIGFDDSPGAVLELLQSIAPQCKRVLRPGGHLYAFFSASLWNESRAIWAGAGFQLAEVVCIWVKTGQQTGGGDWDHGFAPSWEPFLFATDRTRRLSAKHKATFECDAPSGPDRFHPSQKPVQLLQQLINLSTREGEIVFDPFAGAGSTLIAAAQAGRKYIGFEKDPRYHSIILDRLINLEKNTI